MDHADATVQSILLLAPVLALHVELQLAPQGAEPQLDPAMPLSSSDPMHFGRLSSWWQHAPAKLQAVCPATAQPALALPATAHMPGLCATPVLLSDHAWRPSAFALLSCLQASTAVNLGFMVFIAGWIMQVVIIFGYPYTPQYYSDVVVGTVLFTLLPWSASTLAFCFCPVDLMFACQFVQKDATDMLCL